MKTRMGQDSRRSAFTLVELLIVMSILAMMFAMFAPVVARSRSAATQHNAMQAIRQLMPAVQLYAADYDDMFMLPYYAGTEAKTAWYGSEVDGIVDEKLGLLTPYVGRFAKDPTNETATPYKGNKAGFGYNWGYLGSSAYMTDDPVAALHPASMTSLDDLSQTIAFATSAYYNPSWSNGDGRVYDYGFIDPLNKWNGNPTVDFRHHGTRTVDTMNQQVSSDGIALVQFCDGSVKPLKRTQIKQRMFERSGASEMPNP
ncbi:MAG: type II secretion system protein [Fimbriimonadaceae bacterium]